MRQRFYGGFCETVVVFERKGDAPRVRFVMFIRIKYGARPTEIRSKCTSIGCFLPVKWGELWGTTRHELDWLVLFFLPCLYLTGLFVPNYIMDGPRPILTQQPRPCLGELRETEASSLDWSDQTFAFFPGKKDEDRFNWSRLSGEERKAFNWSSSFSQLVRRRRKVQLVNQESTRYSCWNGGSLSECDRVREKVVYSFTDWE